MKDVSFWDWLLPMLIASLGIAARLSHTWAVGRNAVPPQPLTRGDIIASLIGAPAVGIIAYGVGSWFSLNPATQAALCGFSGLFGTAGFITLLDSIGKLLPDWLGSWLKKS